MREAPGQYLHTIFCSELSGEHQVQGEESDEISPRVIISCKRSFIIECIVSELREGGESLKTEID